MKKTSWIRRVCAAGALALALIVTGCGGGGKNSGESHIYDSAEVKDVMNGTGDTKIGEYSVIKADSGDVTQEALEDWYFNYVEPGNFNWAVIVYTDKDSLGVYANNGVVEKDVEIKEDAAGDYTEGSISGATIYTPTDDKTLKAK